MRSSAVGGELAAARRAIVANLVESIPATDKGLAPTLLRTRCLTGRETLAYRATHGAMTAEALEDLGRRASPGPELAVALRDSVAGFELGLLASYAQVIALQTGAAADRAAAVGLYRLLDAQPHAPSLPGRHRDLFPQLLFDEGDLAGALSAAGRKRVTPSVAAFLAADARRPPVGGTDEPTWMRLLSAALVSTPTTMGVTLLPDGPTAFDRLTGAPAAEPADAGERRTSGPLITVVMSAFNPGRPLLTAVRSMVEQTYADWELLVVDDASPNPDWGVLDAVAHLDPRIRLIRKAVNGGTYRCRNTALRQARGDFVTTLDSDDWAHPQRLELGVAPMLANGGILATRSQGVRADDSLLVTRPGYAGPFPAASSLMFRAQPVLGRIGFFDTVRKAADTEYALRLEAAFASPVFDVPRDILTILRSSPESLSADDFAAGWRHEARPAYKQAYGRWHEAIAVGGDPFLDPEGPRLFPGPRRWTKPVDPLLAEPAHFDIVLAGDWRRYGGPQVSMLQEIAACTEAGLRVAVMHLEALRFFTSRDQPLCRPVQDLIADGSVERIFPDDDVSVDILMIRYPPILQFPPYIPKTFTPRRLFVMANQAPREPDGSDPRYLPADVTHAARDLFGAEPTWIPQGPTIRTLLERELPPESIEPWDNPGLIDVPGWFVRGDRPVADRPVVGRFSRDDRIKFPSDPQELLTAYGLPDPYEVRMLGAAVTVPRLLAEAGARLPANWTLHEHKELDVREFLAGLDFVVYMDNPDAYEAFGRALLESATSGAVTIAAPKHAATFGDACLYAEPHEVRSLLDRLVADPDAYRAQVDRAHRWIESHYSTAGFANRICAILDEVRASDVPDPQPAARDSAAAWVSIRTRRAGDGEHADGLAVRYRGQGARSPAVGMLRTLADAVPAGQPLPGDVVAATWGPGVDRVAQESGGEVFLHVREPAPAAEADLP